MFCKNCGVQIDDNVNFCSSCGQSLVEPNNTNNSKKGKGKAISSMVLGIVAIVWAFFALLALGSIPSLVEQLILEYPENILPALIGAFIGFNILSLPTAIPGLALGISSKYKGGMKTSGIVLCSLSLVIALISLVLMIINVFIY